MVLFPSAGSETALDGMVACLSSFIKNAVMNLNNGKTDNLEIEAKFGALIDRGTSKRIFLPVLSECGVHIHGVAHSNSLFLVINYEGWSNFVSDMPVNFHKRFNEALNARVSDRASVRNTAGSLVCINLGMEVSSHSHRRQGHEQWS